MARKCLRCLGGVWEVSEECLGSVLESVREVPEECLRSDWGIFGKCLSNAWECLRSGWGVFGKCLSNAWAVSEKVSGRCLGSV